MLCVCCVWTDHVCCVCVYILSLFRTLGQLSCCLLFSFGGGVKIARQLSVNVINSDIVSLEPSSTYTGGVGRGIGRNRGRQIGLHSGFIPGEKPSR